MWEVIKAIEHLY